MPARRSTNREVTAESVAQANQMSDDQAAANLNVHRAEDRPPVDPMVVTIQSHVAYGHVGNDAAIYPLQASGFEVVDVPTTLLSNHPGFPTMRGEFVEPALIDDLLHGLRERNMPEFATGIISGYLGAPGTADAVASFVRDAKARNPGIRYLCDPVIGDAGGIYVDPALPAAFRDTLVPLADAITPNQFEFDLLTGASVRSAENVVTAARRLNAAGVSVVVATGCELDETPAGHLDIIAVTAESAWRVRAPKFDFTPVGTGDVYTALFAANWFRDGDVANAIARAASGVHEVLTVTFDANVQDMRLIAATSRMLNPGVDFPAEKLSAI